jgi:hypothetical protein
MRHKSGINKLVYVESSLAQKQTIVGFYIHYKTKKVYEIEWEYWNYCEKKKVEFDVNHCSRVLIVY